jgi:hypothetical protein
MYEIALLLCGGYLVVFRVVMFRQVGLGLEVNNLKYIGRKKREETRSTAPGEYLLYYLVNVGNHEISEPNPLPLF